MMVVLAVPAVAKFPVAWLLKVNTIGKRFSQVSGRRKLTRKKPPCAWLCKRSLLGVD